VYIQAVLDPGQPVFGHLPRGLPPPGYSLFLAQAAELGADQVYGHAKVKAVLLAVVGSSACILSNARRNAMPD
jgi:hypothetical protein